MIYVIHLQENPRSFQAKGAQSYPNDDPATTRFPFWVSEWTMPQSNLHLPKRSTSLAADETAQSEDALNLP